uniref:Bromo domain-containing protein n=1 Tax=Fagus sylvatica TaxID=28930 RepID=A0A2N9F3E5_FAGSY
MGKVVERKKKKKKGRPSLLDLQRRTLKEQQPLPPQQKRFYNSTPHSTPNYPTTPAPASSTPLRRSTRRNPIPDEDEDEEDEEEEDEEEQKHQSSGNKKRREKKLKLVLRLPSQKSSLNSASLNSSNSDSNAEEDNAASNSNKKRKINAIAADGSASKLPDSLKGDKSISGANPTSTHQGGQLDSGPSTTLPDKKLLLFILDRLQKKDTYGVFSEPVDPNELPDYHEVIEHPMDFGTVKKKLIGGVYVSLEQFEKDVYLICSNAMQYNAPDTIYFRQARSIHELAKKNFENLRQDSDENDLEPKIVRRGRPPTKNLKKTLGRPSLERAGSEFSADATLATGGENNWSNYDLRKGTHLSDKSALADSSGRLHGSRNNDVYTNWLVDNKFERNDEFPGSMMKGNQIKHGKKPFVFDENRRNTYRQSHPSASGREASVLTTFDGERKQLMAVGIHSEHGYARSLARFAANLGPVAWEVASKKIVGSLPAGVKFGPGWVGENDVIPLRPLLLPSSLPGQLSPLQTFPVIENSPSTATPCAVESKGDDLSEMMPEGNNSSIQEKHVHSTHSALEGHLSKHLPSSATTSASLFAANKSSQPLSVKAEVAEGINSHAGINILNSSASAIRPRPSFQSHQSPVIHPGMNGFNGSYGINIAAQMGKLIGAARPAGFNLQSPQMLDTISRTNTNFVHPATANSLNSEDPSTNSGSSLPNSGNEALRAPIRGLHPRPTWQGLSPQQKTDAGLSPQQKPDSVPPDLNVIFQSPGSPSSSRVDSAQPDLALQL